MNRYRKYIWFSLAKFPSDLLQLPWKGVFLPLHSDVWPGFLRASTAAVAPFSFGTKTWLSLDVFLWEWLYWPCPWCWAEYPALQHCLGTPVGGTPSDGLNLILTDVCMYAGFLFSLYWRSSLCFDTLRLPDVSGLASDEAALAPVACGGRSDCRAFSSFLILVWTCVTHVRYLYRVWAFFYILIYLFHRMCRVEYPTRRHWHRLPALDIQIDGLLPTYVRRLFFVFVSPV